MFQFNEAATDKLSNECCKETKNWFGNSSTHSDEPYLNVLSHQYSPFAMLENNDRVDGAEIRLLKLIGRRFHCKLNFISNIDNDNNILAIRSNKYTNLKIKKKSIPNYSYLIGTFM